MRNIWAWVLWLIPTVLMAAVSPPGYLEMTAVEKRAFHYLEGIQEPYRGELPGILEVGCAQSIAVLESFSKEKLRRTFTEPSGYPGDDDVLRKYFGKGVHSRGPMASGTFVLREKIMGLEPGEYAVTFRFSLANPFMWIVGRYRPGILIIIHRDGLPDLNLVMMPRDGLTGFSREPNPLSLQYTHWLDKPWVGTRMLAAVSFGRVCEDVYTQYVTEELLRNYEPSERDRPTRDASKQIVLTPDQYWRDLYASRRGRDYRERFANMFLEPEQPPFLRATVSDSGLGSRNLGEFYLTSGWINSTHADMWFAQHLGFRLR